MFGKSRRIAALEAALHRQHGVSERWQEDWRKCRRDLAEVRLRLDLLRCLKVHTDGDGKRFIYLPEDMP